MCLQEVKWTIVLLRERERKKCFFIFIFILFDTSVTFYASMFCDSGPCMHCRLCDSFVHLFLPTLVKMGSSGILRYSLSNGLDLDQGRRSVGPRYNIFANGISWRRYTVLHFVGALLRLVEP